MKVAGWIALGLLWVALGWGLNEAYRQAKGEKWNTRTDSILVTDTLYRDSVHVYHEQMLVLRKASDSMATVLSRYASQGKEVSQRARSLQDQLAVARSVADSLPLAMRVIVTQDSVIAGKDTVIATFAQQQQAWTASRGVLLAQVRIDSTRIGTLAKQLADAPKPIKAKAAPKTFFGFRLTPCGFAGVTTGGAGVGAGICLIR